MKRINELLVQLLQNFGFQTYLNFFNYLWGPEGNSNLYIVKVFIVEFKKMNSSKISCPDSKQVSVRFEKI